MVANNSNKIIVEVDGVRHFPLNEMDFRLILSMAKNSLRITETAYDLDCHRNTIVKRIEKIRRITRLDPMNFYDMIKLVDMANKNLEGKADA